MVISCFHPIYIPVFYVHVVEDQACRRRLVTDTVLDSQEEDAALGTGVLAKRTVHEWICPTTVGEFVFP